MFTIRPKLLLLSLFVLLFGLSAYLSTQIAYDPSLSQESLVAILVAVGLYLLITIGLKERWPTQATTVVVVLAGALVALIFITQFGYQDYPETPALIRRLGQLTTRLPNLNLFYLHPNTVATLLDGLLPVAVSMIFMSRRFRLFWGIVSAILAYAILLTASRGSWVALAAVLLLALALVILARFSFRIGLVIVLTGAILLVVALLGIVALGPDRLPFLRSTFATAGDRLTLYRNLTYLASDYAFTGIGPGQTFAMVYSRYGLLIFVPFLTYTHNLPLAVWLGQGLLGLTALLGLTLAVYRLVYHVMRSAQPDPVFHGLWLGFTVTVLHGLTDARQYIESPWTMVEWFILIGLTGAMGKVELFDARAEQSVGGLFRLGAVLVGCLALIVVVFNAPIRALWYTNQGALAETRAELSPNLTDFQRGQLNASAVANYRQALSLDPTQANASRRLGNLSVALGQFENAVPLLETAAAQETVNPAAVKGLGLAYMWVGRTQEAADTLNRLSNPADAANELYTWADFRKQQNQPLLAAYAWETAQLMAPASINLNLWLSLADLYREAGQPEAARRWYARVLEVDPDSLPALDGLTAVGG